MDFNSGIFRNLKHRGIILPNGAGGREGWYVCVCVCLFVCVFVCSCVCWEGGGAYL